MPRKVFFDLDTTLTPSRAPMLEKYIPLFEKLCRDRDVVVVTGGAEEQIRKQLPVPNVGLYFMLSQQGNYAVHKDGTLLWHEQVTPEQEKVVKKFALMLTDEFVTMKGVHIPDRNDIFENRGSQFASSILGFHADNQHKYVVDPDQSLRRELLARHPEELAELHAMGIEAMPAGTTTIDFILVGKNKGYNITRLIEVEKWDKKDCLYIGDALFPGGNDESVIGVIPTYAVQNSDDTFEYIASLLK